MIKEAQILCRHVESLRLRVHPRRTFYVLRTFLSHDCVQWTIGQSEFPCFFEFSFGFDAGLSILDLKYGPDYWEICLLVRANWSLDMCELNPVNLTQACSGFFSLDYDILKPNIKGTLCYGGAN
ncbi:hypothetical protein VNO77_05607 [Canavalia gladiata]|uniref:Uncharacterized protein n=1 Tax=Canavalia gladiata TaxID=3824 RepID=A0AAN9N3V1_CANGL